MTKSKDQERFWSKVTGGDYATCWEWTGGYRNQYGYGMFGTGGRGGHEGMAHRYAYKWMVADIPEGYHVDHLCRNHACVNPWHLEAVPPALNTRRGVVPRLTAEQIPGIRERAARGEHHHSIARDFGVHRTTIRAVVTRFTWKEL